MNSIKFNSQKLVEKFKLKTKNNNNNKTIRIKRIVNFSKLIMLIKKDISIK